jgi:hypothetical protein
MPRTHVNVAIIALLSAALAGCSDDKGTDEPAAKATVLDPAEVHYGKTYSEWNAEWYRWVYQIQYDEECALPVIDGTGANCDVGQSGDVFFLAGNYAAEPGTPVTVVRDDCVAPAGKAVFFPLFNTAADNGGVPPEMQLGAADLEASATGFLESVQPESLIAEVDGEAIPELDRFKTDVVEFSYELPAEPNFYSCLGATGVTGEVSPSYAAGYYVMLEPLSAGTHEIRFGLDQPDDLFSSEIVYHLTVQ